MTVKRSCTGKLCVVRLCGFQIKDDAFSYNESFTVHRAKSKSLLRQVHLVDISKCAFTFLRSEVCSGIQLESCCNRRIKNKSLPLTL
jgi:hypothetical protein